MALTLQFTPASLKPAKKGAAKLVLYPPRLLARPTLRRIDLPDYDRVLNESRLSALALCMFFAALKDSPSTSLRLLALDDILIGLDMANRMKVLDLLQDHFADWQILIFTYSKAWFERLKECLIGKDTDSHWKSVVLLEEQREQETSPRVLVEDSGDRLQIAVIHLRKKDFHGAAVYARIALEGMCHQACAKGAIPVPHVESLKNRKLEHFLDSLEIKLGELADEARRRTALRLITRLREAKMFVLNRNAHFDVEDEDVLSADVGAALAAVTEFSDFLSAQPWSRSNFVSGRKIPARERLSACIGAARESAALGSLKQAIHGVVEANEVFWKVYGSRLGVLFPVGTKPSPQDIWKAAKDQKLLSPEVDARLNVARPYLFGTIKPKDFDVVKFAAATGAMEDLAAPPS